MANGKTKRPAKPTVFLSHSSSNRREVLGLKRLLDERAGGLIDFFLSSDDDSIAHGTIWPEEVRNALDRMTLMLIFVSSEALKSGWTYFEAGYGLHKLGSAKIYCLPGTDKGTLPSPFNILQNRNLHSSRDVGLLIKQCNEVLGASLKEIVSQQEYSRIFKRPLMVQLETAPSFERLAKNVNLSVEGPVNSAEILSKVCKKKGFTVSPGPQSRYDWLSSRKIFITTGLRLDVGSPHLESLNDELPISDEIREAGKMMVHKYSDNHWVESGSYDAKKITISEADNYNLKIKKKNEEIRQRNEVAERGPRTCKFELVPNGISVPIEIVDDWLIAAKVKELTEVSVELNDDIQCEPRVEAITAKIHGSELSLNSDGSYLWRNKVVMKFRWNVGENNAENELELVPSKGKYLLMRDLDLQELVACLFQLAIISLQSRPKSRKAGI